MSVFWVFVLFMSSRGGECLQTFRVLDPGSWFSGDLEEVAGSCEVSGSLIVFSKVPKEPEWLHVFIRMKVKQRHKPQPGAANSSFRQRRVVVNVVSSCV